MTSRTINNLSTVDSIVVSDLLALWSQSAGDSRKMPISQLLTLFESEFASPEFTDVRASPIAGANVSLATQTSNVWLILTPTGTLATLTVTLPPASAAFDGQTILVTCSQVVTVLTVTSSGASVAGAPTNLIPPFGAAV